MDWDTNFPIIANLVFLPSNEKKYSIKYQKRNKIWTYELQVYTSVDRDPSIFGFHEFQSFLKFFIYKTYGISLPQTVFYTTYLLILIQEFKKLFHEDSHHIIDTIFSHMDYLYEEESNYRDPKDSPNTIFIRFGNSFFVKDLHRSKINEDLYSRYYEELPEKNIEKEIKKMRRRWEKERMKRRNEEGKIRLRKTNETLHRHCAHIGIIWKFDAAIELSPKFIFIPSEIIIELSKLYKLMLEEFRTFKSEYCRNQEEEKKAKEIIVEYLEGMKDYFAIREKEKKTG